MEFSKYIINRTGVITTPVNIGLTIQHIQTLYDEVCKDFKKLSKHTIYIVRVTIKPHTSEIGVMFSIPEGYIIPLEYVSINNIPFSSL